MPRKKTVPTEPMSDPPVEVTESTVETTPDPVEQLPSDILTGSTPPGEGLETPSVPSETDVETEVVSTEASEDAEEPSYGHDIRLTQKDLCYMSVSDLRAVYRPGQELDCVVTDYDADEDRLRVSVKAALSDPFEGAERRHPVNSRRQAVISGKYAGGVFCNLPDGTVCMCSYAYQYEDSDFEIGDTVILTVKRFDSNKRQMYGKILSKW